MSMIWGSVSPHVHDVEGTGDWTTHYRPLGKGRDPELKKYTVTHLLCHNILEVWERVETPRKDKVQLRPITGLYRFPRPVWTLSFTGLNPPPILRQLPKGTGVLYHNRGNGPRQTTVALLRFYVPDTERNGRGFLTSREILVDWRR